MPRTSLTRRVQFAAAHRYRRPDWSESENADVFGACAHPHYHGHTYTCDVTVAGPVDVETGFVVDLSFLDSVLQREVHDRFDHRNINLDVPEFAEGKLIPTGENLARFIAERCQSALAHTSARVIRVNLAEDVTLSSCYEVDA
jgi:6-pyruvoyltetrahydropterin/6-carboxytetrahydropterin synthase